jgi:hypothetical protein
MSGARRASTYGETRRMTCTVLQTRSDSDLTRSVSCAPRAPVPPKSPVSTRGRFELTGAWRTRQKRQESRQVCRQPEQDKLLVGPASRDCGGQEGAPVAREGQLMITEEVAWQR